MTKLFKKKNSVQGQNDRDLIANNAVVLEAILPLVEDEEMKNELTTLRDKVKYTTALVDEKGYSLDKKIAGIIGDIKIEVTKNKGDEKSTAKINSLIKDLKALVAERNAMV
jgi:hypothetical protein